MVIDILGVEASITHHFRAYGFYAPAVGDYSNHHIMDWLGTRESKALYAIEDPLSYKDRLALPKLMMNACGDQFFLPDSSQFYFDQLPGPKYLRYIPNTDHSLKNTDAMDTLRAWHHALLHRTTLPQLTWKHDRDGSVVVKSSAKPQSVLFWQATNPTARDFRLESFGPGWTSTPVAEKDGAFHASPVKPEKGWTASMVELTFDIGAGAPLKLTTNVVVTPDTLPFPAPNVPRPTGFLSK
jgi:PhoPQ-activated pathogenicity-related protein